MMGHDEYSEARMMLHTIQQDINSNEELNRNGTTHDEISNNSDDILQIPQHDSVMMEEDLNSVQVETSEEITENSHQQVFQKDELMNTSSEDQTILSVPTTHATNVATTLGNIQQHFKGNRSLPPIDTSSRNLQLNLEFSYDRRATPISRRMNNNHMNNSSNRDSFVSQQQHEEQHESSLSSATNSPVMVMMMDPETEMDPASQHPISIINSSSNHTSSSADDDSSSFSNNGEDMSSDDTIMSVATAHESISSALTSTPTRVVVTTNTDVSQSSLSVIGVSPFLFPSSGEMFTSHTRAHQQTNDETMMNDDEESGSMTSMVVDTAQTFSSIVPSTSAESSVMIRLSSHPSTMSDDDADHTTRRTSLSSIREESSTTTHLLNENIPPSSSNLSLIPSMTIQPSPVLVSSTTSFHTATTTTTTTTIDTTSTLPMNSCMTTTTQPSALSATSQHPSQQQQQQKKTLDLESLLIYPPTQVPSNVPDVPNHFQCPISKLIMYAPVKNMYDKTYERESIEQWWKTLYTKQQPLTDPLTNQNVSDRTLHEDVDLKNQIQEFLNENPHLRFSINETYFPKQIIREMKVAIDSENIEKVRFLLSQFPASFFVQTKFPIPHSTHHGKSRSDKETSVSIFDCLYRRFKNVYDAKIHMNSGSSGSGSSSGTSVATTSDTNYSNNGSNNNTTTMVLEGNRINRSNNNNTTTNTTIMEEETHLLQSMNSAAMTTTSALMSSSNSSANSITSTTDLVASSPCTSSSSSCLHNTTTSLLLMNTTTATTTTPSHLNDTIHCFKEEDFIQSDPILALIVKQYKIVRDYCITRQHQSTSKVECSEYKMMESAIKDGLKNIFVNSVRMFPSTSIMDWLISMGASLSSTNQFRQNAFHMACMTDQLEIAKHLYRLNDQAIGEKNVNPDEKNDVVMNHTSQVNHTSHDGGVVVMNHESQVNHTSHGGGVVMNHTSQVNHESHGSESSILHMNAMMESSPNEVLQDRSHRRTVPTSSSTTQITNIVEERLSDEVKRKWNAFYLAIWHNSYRIIDWMINDPQLSSKFLSKKLKCMVKDKSSIYHPMNALSLAVYKRNIPLVETLITKYGFDVSEEKYHPIYWSCIANDLNGFQWICDFILKNYGPDALRKQLKSINERAFRRSLIHAISMEASDEMMEYLLQKCKEFDVLDVVINSQDNFGNTALHYACEKSKTKTIQCLIREGIAHECINRQGKTASQCCKTDDDRIVLQRAIREERELLKKTMNRVKDLEDDVSFLKRKLLEMEELLSKKKKNKSQDDDDDNGCC
ncbi:hypothetical protein C9374_013376 [Naegleria lovaniensis]|uniref:U-box domain-containing protein n=1 Tax=Naegleria lovaniensis TaxID=51637 RepID=A0AA88H0G7_NAELO|nr:uncharacterized protein C9374_013376 [Naegleria lovaniensis]KAG2391891.1 hypothetical protein C9374_013376 [Naegleria lovaniensis]